VGEGGDSLLSHRESSSARQRTSAHGRSRKNFFVNSEKSRRQLRGAFRHAAKMKLEISRGAGEPR
jgi:hypothetical protein